LSNVGLVVTWDHALSSFKTRFATIKIDIHLTFLRYLNMNFFGDVSVQDRLVKRNLVIASVILTILILWTSLFVSHLFGVHFLGFNSSFEAHVGAGAGGVNTTLVAVD